MFKRDGNCLYSGYYGNNITIADSVAYNNNHQVRKIIIQIRWSVQIIIIVDINLFSNIF